MRLTDNDKYSKNKPDQTITDLLNKKGKDGIDKELENYIEDIDSDELCYNIGSHIKYEVWDNSKNKYLFRLGGYLKLIKPEYIVLKNSDDKTWCVQKSKDGKKTKFHLLQTEKTSYGGGGELDETEVELAIKAIQEREEIIDEKDKEINKLKQYIINNMNK